MKSKILVTGRNGQIGYEIVRVMSLLGNVIKVDIDLSKPEQIVSAIREHKPKIVVNSAAYTAVDTAEERVEYAMAVNANAPGIIAEEVKKYAGLIVHFSTDFAYDGNKKAPYHESDPVNPLSAYARSKVAGDVAIIDSGAKHLIFRTSWVYGARGKNFLRTMLQMCADRSEFKVVNDQLGAPTWSRALAECVGIILSQKEAFDSSYSGLYHMSSEGRITWYEFAVHIARYYEKQTGKRIVIFPESSGQYPMKAPRPKYAILDNSKLNSAFRVSMPFWITSFRQVMEDLGYSEPDCYKEMDKKSYK